MEIVWTARIHSPDHRHDFTLPARVPGCIHADLLRAGLVCDPFWRDSNESLQWIEDCDVTYTGTFRLDAVPQDAHLVFRGLDVYAAVSCNGVRLGETDNMHISWEFAVSGVLRTGENTLTVAFRSPVREVAGLPPRSAAFTCERLYTRRVQCTYGWDWVGRFVTMGIWKPVELVVRYPDWIGDRTDGIYVRTANINPFGAQVAVSLRFENVTGNAWTGMEILDPGGRCVWRKRRRVLTSGIEELADIPDAALWYPAGYGAHPLYRLRVRTFADGETTEAAETRVLSFGIRTVTILEPEDAPDSDAARLARKLKECPHLREWDRNEGSSAFWLLINGVRVFCQGANWVPCEPLPSEESPEKIGRLVSLALTAGVNMLRVWGGGVFAPEALLDACDRAGILVTQDFLMACGDYPEEDPAFLDQLRHEAREAALTMRNHPCLVWWSGDNENAVSGNENAEHYNGRLAALFAIGPELARHDPARRFLPSSPYGGVPYASGVRGTSHNTQYLGSFFAWVREGRFSGYREYFDTYLDRFTAEQPAIGMPFVSCLRKFMTDENIFGEDTRISEYHTKNNPGLGAITLYGYVERLAAGIFGPFTDGTDRVRKMQWLHCEWIRLSMELFRRHAWYSSGILYWMWNDCWPAANGWAIVDWYGMPKPAWYSFKRCAKPLIASIQLLDDLDGSPRTQVFLSHNGTGPDARGRCRLYRYDIRTGAEQTVRETDFRVPAGSAVRILDGAYEPMDDETVLIADVESDRGRDRAFSLPPGRCYADMPFVLEAPQIVEETDERIRVRAASTIPYAFVDPGDTVLETNGVFLKKGEEAVYRKTEVRAR